MYPTFKLNAKYRTERWKNLHSFLGPQEDLLEEMGSSVKNGSVTYASVGVQCCAENTIGPDSIRSNGPHV